MAFIIRIISVDYLYSHTSDLKIHQRQRVYYHFLLLLLLQKKLEAVCWN